MPVNRPAFISRHSQDQKRIEITVCIRATLEIVQRLAVRVLLAIVLSVCVVRNRYAEKNECRRKNNSTFAYKHSLLHEYFFRLHTRYTTAGLGELTMANGNYRKVRAVLPDNAPHHLAWLAA
jgi:hypothetical protein